MTISPIWRMFGLLAAVAAIAAAAPAQAGKRDNSLNVAFPRAMRTVDALYSTNREHIIFSQLTDDALFHLDQDTGQPVPLAAESFELADDKTLVVRIRDDVTFHDGAPLTAADVAYTYGFVLNRNSKSDFTDRFENWLEAVDEVDPRTVRFRMKQPYALAFYDLALYTKLRKKGTYDKLGAPGGLNPDAQLMTLNGTGPYRVTQFDPGRRIMLKRHPGYRKGGPKGNPAIETITIRFIPEEATQIAEMLNGGLDWAFNIQTDLAEQAASTGKVRYEPGAAMRVGYVVLDAAGFTGANNPLTKVEVRQALNHAVNREAIVKELVRGRSEVIHAPCNPIQFGCPKDVRQYPYDLAKAKELLAKAGYPNGFTLELMASREKPVIEAVAEQIGRSGVKVNLRYIKGPTLDKAQKDRTAQAFLGTYASQSIPDAGAILPDKFAANADDNFSQDPRVHELAILANATLDPVKREAHFREAFHLIADKAYVIPLYKFTINYLLANDLELPTPEDELPRFFLARWK